MSLAISRTMPLSLGRRVICDLLQLSMQVPRVSVQRVMQLAELATAREYAQPRPSWCSIFTKAYAKVVAYRPELRRALLTFPWERMVEYDNASADVAVEMQLGNETNVFFVPLKTPDTMALTEIDERLNECKENPVERMQRLRRALMVARLPRVLRRMIWWSLLNISGAKRARYFNTFGVTSVAGRGADLISPLAPCITVLYYGALDARGRVSVSVTFDHRVMDGSAPARALVEMEEILNAEIRQELNALRRLRLFRPATTIRQAS